MQDSQLLESQVFWLRDYVCTQEFADSAGASYVQALRFLQADQRSDFWYYSEQDVLEEIAKMKPEFKSEILSPTITFETLAGRVARQTGLELIGEAAEVTIYSNGW
jgi:hypothetical protein